MTNFKAHNLKVVGSNPTPATKNLSRKREVFCYEDAVNGLPISGKGYTHKPIFALAWKGQCHCRG